MKAIIDCRILLIGVFATALVAPTELAAQRTNVTAEIVGTWRGTSICSDKKAAPSCNDEQVIYDVVVNKAKPDAVIVKADKVVNGKRDPMGDLDFTYDAKSGSWTAEFENPRTHNIFRLIVKGDVIAGTLTMLPSNAVVRKIDLRKDR